MDEKSITKALFRNFIERHTYSVVYHECRDYWLSVESGQKLRGSPWFPIAFSIFLYATVLLMPMTFTSMVAYEDFVINAYFWLMLGILFPLPTLPLSSQFANVPAPAPGPRLRAG